MGEQARRFGWINVQPSSRAKVRPQTVQCCGRPGKAVALTPEDRIDVTVHLKEPWRRFCPQTGTKAGEALVARTGETRDDVRRDAVPGWNKNGKEPTPKGRSETPGSLDRLVQDDLSGASNATLGGTHLLLTRGDLGFMVRMVESVLQHDNPFWCSTN
jgi:hypothetical protein